jgi:hypothetical protein
MRPRTTAQTRMGRTSLSDGRGCGQSSQRRTHPKNKISRPREPAPRRILILGTRHPPLDCPGGSSPAATGRGPARRPHPQTLQGHRVYRCSRTAAFTDILIAATHREPTSGLCRYPPLGTPKTAQPHTVPPGWAVALASELLSPSRHLRRADSQGRKGRRPAGYTTGQVRSGDQPKNRQGARPDHSGGRARHRRRGDRISGGDLRNWH